MAEWYPHLWLRWGDALQEAGYAPNLLQGKVSDETLIEKYIEFVRELGRIPVEGEIRRKAREDQSFPSHSVFGRFGGKTKPLNAVSAHCRTAGGFEDVLSFCPHEASTESPIQKVRKPKVATGFVYLMKSGRHYKIGRTKSVGRRNSLLKSRFRRQLCTASKQTTQLGLKVTGTAALPTSAAKVNGLSCRRRT
jgi:hypothetical protein